MGIITAVSHGFSVNDAVIFSTTGSLPVGLAPNTFYYVIAEGFTANQFEVSNTLDGTMLIFTAPQSGVHTVSKTQNPPVRLSWSNDGGHTFGNEYQASLGAIGQYKSRLVWRRLGYARDRVFRIVVDAPVKKVLIQGYVEVSR